MEYVKPLDGIIPPLFLVMVQAAKKPDGILIISVREKDESGQTKYTDTVNFHKASARKKLCENLANLTGSSFSDSVLMQAFSEFNALKMASPDLGVFNIVLRKMTENDAQGVSLSVPPDADSEGIAAVFRHAIDDMAVMSENMILTWPKSCAGKLAVVDVDYHHYDNPPDASYIEALAEAVRPRPLAWWRSHGGGLHLVYVPFPPFAANELAACAVLAVQQIDPTATVELLTSTRHPRSPRK